MPHPREATLSAGVVIDGRYELVRPLGTGGMGEVYAARRRALGDEVAIKRLLPDQDTPSNRQRFATEAQAAAHIRHPNVVQVFDYGDDAAIGPYLVMEKLDGQTLSMELGSGRMAIERAVWVFSAVCAAVEAGHRRGIVHRDLKPANVIIAPTDDGRQVVKVLDFGLAVDLRLPSRDITQPGSVIGTVIYMSPEQTEGAPASPRSDVFALGIMLYEMVTGALPFDGPTSLETMLAISGGRYRPAQEHVPDLPAGVIAAIEAALQRDPMARPSSPERLAQLAAAGMSIDSLAPPPTARSPSRGMATVRLRGDSGPTQDTEQSLPVFGRFVARDAELARLHDGFAKALAGRPPLVLITGEPGIGKSRLMDRFAVDAREKGALALGGRFFDYTGSRPPPLETFVTMLASAGPTGESAAARAQENLDAEAAAGAQWNAFAAIADALSGQAAGRPLVVLLDDLHWASRVDLELVDHLHRSLGPRATLLVATARAGSEGDMAAWRARRASSIVELALAPFSEADLIEWLEAVFRGIRVGAIEVRRLLRATGGNPYAVAEVARHLVAREELVRDDAGWRLNGLGSVELPDSVAAMVRARMAELAAPHRAVLETAAVIGDEFRVATLAAAAGSDERTLDDALDAGFAARLLSDRDVSAGNDYRFASALTRQVMYDELPARARRRVHRAVANALVQIYGDHDDRFAHVFGYHYHAVGAWAEALGFGVRAAHEAVARGDYDMAQAAIARADEACVQLAAGGSAPDAAQRARLDYLAGTVATALGDLDEGAARLGRAIAAGAAGERGDASAGAGGERGDASASADAGGDRSDAGAIDAGLAIDARIELARNLGARGELVRAVAAAEQAARAAGAAGDATRGLMARVVAADVGGRAGLVSAASLDGLCAETEHAAPGLRARALMVRAWRRMKAGDFAAAEHDAQAARDLARAAGQLDTQLRAVSTQSAIRSEAGDVAGSIDLAEEVLAMARRLGDRRREGISLANLGEGWVELGEAKRGHEHLTAALQIFVDIGDRACEGDCRVNVGRALLALGHLDDAIAMLGRAAEMCATTSRVEYEGIAHMLLGEARERRGQLGDARADFGRAVELFERIDLNLRWRAELGLARVLAGLGEPALAHIHATRAHEQLALQRRRLARGTDPAAIDAALAEADQLLAMVQ